VEDLDVRVFYGSGIYASDSFRMYSPLLPGGGAPRDEERWIAKRTRAVDRWAVARRRPVDASRRQRHRRAANVLEGRDEDGEEKAGLTLIDEQDGEESGMSSGPGVEEVGDFMSDEEQEEDEQQWRRVVPGGTSLEWRTRRYLRALYRADNDRQGAAEIHGTPNPHRKYPVVADGGQIWRWGLEGIVYDIHRGVRITRPRDRRRLAKLLADGEE
jgi:hypothetical protein